MRFNKIAKITSDFKALNMTVASYLVVSIPSCIDHIHQQAEYKRLINVQLVCHFPFYNFRIADYVLRKKNS